MDELCLRLTIGSLRPEQCKPTLKIVTITSFEVKLNNELKLQKKYNRKLDDVTGSIVSMNSKNI